MSRTDGVPPFPEGSDWADPAAVFDDTPAARSGRQDSLMVLWACVAVFPVIALVLLRADAVVYDATNIDDIGPLDGAPALLAVGGAIVFGALPLVLAVLHTAAALRRRTRDFRRASRGAALYTAACGLVTAPYWAWGTHSTAQDRRVTASAVHEAYALSAATAVMGLLPLVLYLVLALPRRERSVPLSRRGAG